MDYRITNSDIDKKKVKLLLVEDDQAIAFGLEYSLAKEYYEVTICKDAASAKKKITFDDFDIVLLDISLPDGNGFDLCRMIKMKKDIPVIFITARDDEGSVVMGLDIGADDYVTKPFRMLELQSRIRSVLRRAGKEKKEEHIIQIGNLSVNISEGKVTKEGKEIFLTALEYKLFLTLINHEGTIITREQLLESIWDVSGEFVNDNTLTVYIKRLRDKIEDDPQKPSIIKTVRGLGYKV